MTTSKVGAQTGHNQNTFTHFALLPLPKSSCPCALPALLNRAQTQTLAQTQTPHMAAGLFQEKRISSVLVLHFFLWCHPVCLLAGVSLIPTRPLQQHSCVRVCSMRDTGATHKVTARQWLPGSSSRVFFIHCSNFALIPQSNASCSKGFWLVKKSPQFSFYFSFHSPLEKLLYCATTCEWAFVNYQNCWRKNKLHHKGMLGRQHKAD